MERPAIRRPLWWDEGFTRSFFGLGPAVRGARMLKAQQTEFWSLDQLSPQRIPGASVEALEETGEHTSVSSVRRDNAGPAVYHETMVYAVDHLFREESEPAVDVSVRPDVAVEVCNEAGPDEAEPSLQGEPECEPEATPRPVVDVPRSAAPRFNMARFLRLTGTLDKLEDEGRWYQLPRRLFRPRVALDSKQRISRGFVKDLRMPTCSSSDGRND